MSGAAEGGGALIRLGIVGADVDRGWFRDAHFPALQVMPGFAIEAVSARSQTKADAAAAHFGAARGFGDTAELVRDPGIDLVVVTVRAPEHRGAVLAALDAGKHVYCEWPLGSDLAEAEEMAAAVRPGQRAFIGAQGLSAPAVRRAIALVREGAIGRPLVLRGYNTAAAWGARVPFRSFVQDKALGSTLATIGLGHVLPTIEALVGSWREIDARASFLHPTVHVEETGEDLPRLSEDHVLAIGLHTTGCISTIEAIGGTSERTALIEIVGERGWLRIFGEVSGTYQIARLGLEGSVPVGDLPPPAAPQLVGPPANLAEVYERLAIELRDGTHVLPDFDDALRITRVLEAIQRSSDTGERQRL